MNKLSVIVPCYNEQEVLPYFYYEISNISQKMSDISFEFIFIDDGSKDGTLKKLYELHSMDNRVQYISFSRNFGKEAAIYAGLKESTGDYVAVMDVDLQDPPNLLEEMYRYIKNENYDCVATRRTTRKGEPPIRSFFARRFYSIINKISNINIVDGARDFRLMTRQMVDSLLELSEYNRFSKGLFSWVGFNTKYIEYENTQRIAGTTKWSFWKLLAYSLDGIVGFSTAPLAISSIIGFIFCMLSFVSIVFIIIRQLLFGGSAFGWPSLVCIIFFLTGIQLFCTGILGQYMAKTYLETKKRPIYICKERSNSYTNSFRNTN